MELKAIDPKALVFNPFHTFAEEWPLLTAGDEMAGYNTMTISWGHIGSLWGDNGGRPTMVVYVRPHRYTFEFMNRHELFTVSVLPQSFKKELAYLGKVSGRDEDKIAKAGITPVFGYGSTFFQESKMVFVCRKLYQSEIQEAGFKDVKLMDSIYPQKDFHTMYVGEIEKVLTIAV